MNRNHRFLLVVTVVVVLLGAASALTWNSQAASVPEAPVPGGPGFYTQNALAFRPYNQYDEWAYQYLDLYNPSATSVQHAAPLLVPHGATVTQFVAYFYDTSTYNLNASLFRCRLDDTHQCDVMAEAVSLGTPGYSYWTDNTISYPVIDNQSYMYAAEIELPGGAGSSLRLVAVRVDYEFSAKLPLVTKNH